MTAFRLIRDIYTSEAFDAGIAAFAQLCDATREPHENHSVLTIMGTDMTLKSELLNYILALSAQELLT